MKWFLKVLNQYFDFNGRARRKEYWMFTLFTFIISWSCSLLDTIFGIYIFSIISLVISLLLFIPALAVLVRRLHDTGKSGWYFCVVFIPIAGVIWLIVLLCMEGEGRPNKWGQNPKGIGSDRAIDLIGKE